MATAIQNTPVLKGKDAKRFFRLMEENKNKEIPKEERDRIKSNYEKLKATLRD